jgi:glycosyltransferase involved in cell wall biosynthesis
MKLVWLSHFIPFPPRGGSRQRSFNLIRHISAKYETHVVALNMQGETQERAAEYAIEFKKYCAQVKIWEPPFRWRGARWWGQLVLSPFYRHPYGSRALWSPELGRRWESVLAKHPGALVHFDSIDLALYFPPAAGFRKVLNHHNCESAMAERRAQREANSLKKAYLWHQARKLRRLEEQLCHHFDVNLTVSELDTQTLRERNPQAHCQVVENGTDTEYFHPSEVEPEPNTLIFAGSLDWYPNISGIQFFARDVWPHVQSQRPAVRLYLAGRKPAPWVVQWAAREPQVKLVADPEDIRPWVAHAAVFICPIVDGGGTRVKILDAMAMGKPVISTTVGCEGLEVWNGENIVIADAPLDFGAKTLQMLRDKGLRDLIAAQGRALVERMYSWDVIGERLHRVYESVVSQQACGGKSDALHMGKC